jgi:putative transposase
VLHIYDRRQDHEKKFTGQKFPIYSQSTQAVVHKYKYIWARVAAKKAREQGITTVKYPYKQKKNFNSKWAKDGLDFYENG